MPVERGLHDPALHPPASPMNHANLAESSLRRLGQILRDNGRHVARREGVQIKLGLDGNTNRLDLIVRKANGIVRHVCLVVRWPAGGIRP